MKTNYYKPFVMRNLITLSLILFMVSPTFSQEYKVRMAFMGNSITAGVGTTSAATDAYPVQLDALLQEKYGDTVDIKNFSVSGRTMLRNAENPLWNEPVFPQALQYVPDICLIMLGTNDSKPYLVESIGNEFFNDYMAMVDTFKFRNPDTKFILVRPTPIWEGHPYGTEYSNFHNDSLLMNFTIPRVDSVAKLTGAIVVDFHEPFVDSLQYFPDKLHPNTEGAAKMAKILYDMFEEENLVHQVDAGLAYVSVFKQNTKPVAVGSLVELTWSTIFADSVFLDGELVDASGTIEVTAVAGKQYVLTAKGERNVSEFPLTLDAYVPEKTSIKINPSNYAFQNGKPVTLYSRFVDQRGKLMNAKSLDITWSVLEGEGIFGEQSDSSVVFTPGAVESVKVEAREGDVFGTFSRSVNPELFVSVPEKQVGSVTVYPVPASETLHFRLAENTIPEIDVRIFNILGEEVISRNLHSASNGSSHEINISGLKEGVYIYTVTAGTDVTFGKFLKSGTNGSGN